MKEVKMRLTKKHHKELWGRIANLEAEKADMAFDLYTKILEARSAETNRVIYLGHLFKQIRDKKLYKCLDSECENFNEFLAMPELGFQRSTAYSYIRIYEKYVEELNYDVGYLAEIGHKKLQLILPFVDKDATEWLSRAKTWSYKDLLNQIRKERGRQPMKEPKEVQRGINKNYADYVGEHSCIFHPERKSEKAHFPKTQKAGGLSTHIIPLCHDCHMHYHDLGVVSFFEAYRNQIMDYFYDLIEKLYEEIRCLSQ